MVDCPLFNHCKEDCEQCTDETKKQTIEEMAMDIIPVVTEAINALIPMIADCINAVVDFTISLYPNKRIVWLALYHPKERVRKKNKNRIIHYFKKII